MMKALYLVTVLQFIFIGIVFSQVDSNKIKVPIPSFLPDEKLTIEFCNKPKEVIPKYKFGTNEELIKLITSRLKYPNEQCIGGKTFLLFYVNKKGQVESPEIKRSISKKIDMQLLKLIPQYEFEPGTYNGIICKYQVIFPIWISLQ